MYCRSLSASLFSTHNFHYFNFMFYNKTIISPKMSFHMVLINIKFTVVKAKQTQMICLGTQLMSL